MSTLLIFLFFMISGMVQSQKIDKDSIFPENNFIIEGDSIISTRIELKEVTVFENLNFSDYNEAKKYVILRERVYLVYPYAKLAADRLNILSNRLKNISLKRKRKLYLRRVEDFVYNEFEEELKKLSRNQGKILIKLVHRQTGNTTHELIKEFRNGLKAFIYQTTASIFKLSLKERFNPNEIYEDYLIEDILQRGFSNGRLISQNSALDYNLDSLYLKWSKNK